jgi:hypothetical protein
MTETTDRTDLFGGIALGIAALAALGIANSALAPYYDALIHVTAEIRIGSLGLSKSIEHWVNDGLMAIFFLLVGLEIKREVIDGSRLLACRRWCFQSSLRSAGSSCRRQSMARSTGKTPAAWQAGPFRRPPISPLQSEFALCLAGPFQHR